MSSAVDLTIAVVATDPGSESQASVLAQLLDLPLLSNATAPRDCREFDVCVVVQGAALYLQQTGRGAPGPVAVEFGSAGMRHRRKGGQNEMLGRAVGVVKKPDLAVLDATAGLGRDGFILADIGCQVTLCERDPLVAQLLHSGIEVAVGSRDPWLQQVLGRMKLHPADARQLAPAELAGVDVIYLDPMFPDRDKKARVKKEMALFHTLLDASASQDDADQLLLWALQQEVARVVVKRPAKAPQLAGRKPSHTIEGKAVRYDVYVLKGLAA